MHDSDRRDFLLNLLSLAIDQHDRWAQRDDLPYVTAGLDEAFTDLIDGFSDDSIPGDLRQLEQLVSTFGVEWRAWQTAVDQQGASIVLPKDSVWRAWEAVTSHYAGITSDPPPPLESVCALRTQGVSDRQICEIYGWMDHQSRPEVWRIDEELASPGKHTRNHVDPVSKLRQKREKQQEDLADRVRRLRERKIARATASPPETLAELIQQNVPLHQISGILRMTESEVLAQCEAEGLPAPASGQAIQSIPGTHDQPLSDSLARQFDATESARRDRDQVLLPAAKRQSGSSDADLDPDSRLVAEPDSGMNATALAIDDSMSLEQQIVHYHLAGFEATEIASELSTPEERITRQKVSAVIRRYEEDPEMFAVPTA